MTDPDASEIVRHPVPTRRVGDGTGHSFFGYYNKTNFDPADSRLLAHRVPMITADLTGRETAEVGFFDFSDRERFVKLGETTTWNWQMGSQLQWMGDGDTVLFNSRAAAPRRTESPFPDFRSTVVDTDTGARRDLPLPVYVLSPDGRFALSVNYSRFMVTHRTIGYPATHAEPDLAPAPADDGILSMDTETGAWDMAVSLERLRNFEPAPSMDNAIHWVTHLESNPSGTRFLFLHRWTERVADETCFLHRLFTMNRDGSDLHLLEDTDHPLPQLAEDFDPNAVGTFDYEKSEYQVSHPMWKSDDEIIVWSPHDGEIRYHLYNERTGAVSVIGQSVLTENGHMSYSPDRRWILSDTYPDPATNERSLFLFDTEAGRRIDIGNFYTPPDLGKHNRCDLHPRWSRDGRYVCIDSVHKGSRQMYLLDVGDIVNRPD